MAVSEHARLATVEAYGRDRGGNAGGEGGTSGRAEFCAHYGKRRAAPGWPTSVASMRSARRRTTSKKKYAGLGLNKLRELARYRATGTTQGSQGPNPIAWRAWQPLHTGSDFVDYYATGAADPGGPHGSLSRRSDQGEGRRGAGYEANGGGFNDALGRLRTPKPV